MNSRWYDCVGGLGLEVQRFPSTEEDDGWRVAGYIQEKRRGKFEVRVNRHEETRTDAIKYDIESAKAELLRLCGVQGRESLGAGTK